MNMQLPPELAAQLGAGAPAAPAEEPYKKHLRRGFIGLAVLVIGVFGWAALAKINGAVLASGLIAVEGQPKTVQHLDGGIVAEILVQDGQTVKRGDVLMRLDPTMIDVNREIVDVQMNETMARVTRLQAERDGLSKITWPETLIAAQEQPRVRLAMEGQRKLFEARRNATLGNQAQLYQRIDQLNDQIDGLGALAQSKESQMSKIREEAKSKRVLVDRGYLGKPAVLALEREELRLQGDVANHRSEIARLQNSINETRSQISQLGRDRQAEVLTELRQAETEASGFREQLTAASAQSERIEILSPVDGKVHNMAMTTEGGVISPGAEIMQIIPSDARLIIEAQVQPVDIDQVYPGQPTRVMLSAFNARRTPEMNGSVFQIAPDRIIDPITGFPYYLVKIEIPPEELGRLDESLTLIPGMPAESFMKTESRSVLNYLWKPAGDAMRRAGREE